MDKPFCITFAGPPGSSKTPIAYYLSWNLKLPILNNDSMRTETQEDVGELNIDVYKGKRDDRLKRILSSKIDFIYDASIDREWSNKADWVDRYGYQIFIISLDFSLEKLKQIYKYKGYDQVELLERAYLEHQKFLEVYGSIIDLHISDKDFEDRLNKCLQAAKKWLNKRAE